MTSLGNKLKQKTIMEVKKLSFSYDTKNIILKDVSFSVDKGDFVAIVGQNGSGKTTLINIILNLIKIQNRKKHIIFYTNTFSYVPQENLILKNFPCTVFELIRTGLMASKLKFFYNKKDKQKVQEIAKNLGIDNLLEKQFNELSGGQKQKVLIARALIIRPQLLILDEATANMDKKSENIFFEHIRKLKEQPTIILVSHNINTVSKYVTKVICLNKSAQSHDISKTDNKDYNLIIHKHCGMHSGD